MAYRIVDIDGPNSSLLEPAVGPGLWPGEGFLMNDDGGHRLQAQLLRCHMSALVPLVIQEYLLGQRVLHFPRYDLAQAIAAHGDAILYHKPGRTAQVAFVLVEILATLAFAPGGVDFLGLHFEVPPRQALAILEEQERLRSMPQTRPSAPPDPKLVKTAQAGRSNGFPSPTFQERYRRRPSPPLQEA